MNFNPGRSCAGDAGSHQSQPDINMAFKCICLAAHAKLLSCPPQGTSHGSVPPGKHPSCRLFPFTRRSSSQAQGECWENLEQAAPLVAESSPHPGQSPNLSQPGLLWFLLSCLLCRAVLLPAQALQPCSASLCWSQADVLTCEQLLFRHRYPRFQRAKSLGQLGKAGRGHRLDLLLLCTPRGASHEAARALRWGWGPSWCLCMLETISV